MVRTQAAIAFRGKSYPLAFIMADVCLTGALAHSENHVWLHPQGSLAALPLPAPNTWRLFVEITRQRDGRTNCVTLDAVRGFMAERAPGLDATIVGEPLWLSEFRINCRMVDRTHDPKRCWRWSADRQSAMARASGSRMIAAGPPPMSDATVSIHPL